MLTKQTIIDRIEVLESGHIQIRAATRILEDGAAYQVTTQAAIKPI